MSGRTGGRPPLQVERLSVILDIDGATRTLGTLAWKRDERRAYFEYHRDFLAAPLPVSPLRLRVGAGVKAAPYEPFDGLHGLFSDSLPDGWGRKLLDRRLQKAGLPHLSLTALDRLAYVGGGGMGALRYLPEKMFGQRGAEQIDLDWVADQAELVQRELAEGDVDLLFAVQGGSGGVRPKAMIGLNPATESVVADAGHGVPAAFDPWIVKFRSIEDPAEIGAEEYAYSLMARAAGITLSETRLIETSKGGRYFATRRFDRTPQGRVHVHTASGLLDASHKVPAIGYDELLTLTMALTRDVRHVREMFRRMAFNVLAHNRDDHSRNHAFMMDAAGTWRPAPAYDLTFSLGAGGEHNLAVAGEGRNPGLPDILRVAAKAGVGRADAERIYAEVRDVVQHWGEFADRASLSARRTTELDQVLNGSR